MTVLLSEGELARFARPAEGGYLSRERSRPEARATRIGIINLMPRAETYEQDLLRPLARSLALVEPVWIRLTSPVYSSSDRERMLSKYVLFQEVLDAGSLDGLILTGAPVEELAFQSVGYWGELAAILETARERVPSTLGICWGGLALARLLGIEKVRFPRKLFGVFPLHNIAPDHPVLGGTDDVFPCPQSRHSGITDLTIADAEARGKVRPLAYSPEAGHSIFESADRRYLMHLGHPEYEPARLAFEYFQDLKAGRKDVDLPRYFDVERPQATWRAHRTDFFSAWVRSLRPCAPARSCLELG